MKEISIGIPDFETLRTRNLIYIDKTKSIYELVRLPRYIFISRPRRFGKTLLVSTLEKIFQGRRDLFKDLYIDKTNYEWIKYPVVKIGMAGLDYKNPDEFERGLKVILNRIAENYELKIDKRLNPGDILSDIIIRLSKKHGKVALLIDEYDKPIVDHLTNPELAEIMRFRLANFYGVIKDLGEFFHFVFITGVTKFSKTSLFSKLNNLDDITINPKYCDLLGYTENEIKDNFAHYHLEACNNLQLTVDELYEKLKNWYDGFRFSKNDLYIYNPHSIMSFYENRDFFNFWFSTGTPTFLYKLIKEKKISLYNIAPIRVDQQSAVESAYEPNNISLEHLLLQTGYLTIKEVDNIRNEFILDYTNYEIQSAFFQGLFEKFAHLEAGRGKPIINDLIESLLENKIDYFCKILKTIFASIPVDLHISAEAYYHSIIYVINFLMGFRVYAEMPSALGYADLIVHTPTHIYVIEFKLNRSAEQALKQIKEKKYYERYLLENKKIVLVGIAFDDRNIINEPIVEIIEK